MKAVWRMHSCVPRPHSCGCSGQSSARVPMWRARVCALLFLLTVPLLATVDGVVTNQTTGQPQAGATVALYKLGGAGMEAAGQAKTDAQGTFTIAAEVQGPHLLQSVWEGVTYNHMLPPGSRTTGLRLDVYNSVKKQPPAAKIAQHMILLEPGNGQ